MAKEKSTDSKMSKEDRKAARKAEKKATKSGSEPTGVTKSKSDKKDKKEKRKVLAEKVLNEVDSASKSSKKAKAAEKDDDDEEEDEDDEVDAGDETAVDMEVDGNEAVKKNEKSLASKPAGALVPFANPLADEKVAKKVFKGVKKAAAQRTLKRGVKEVVKALRKSAVSTGGESLPIGVVVLAADISPMDVISHIPVLAEDHGIPYIYVTSRAELGLAGQTKRPTSVVMISRDVGAKKGAGDKDAEGGDGESWEETYKGLVKVVEREGRHVKI
ncbi:snoRNA-binding protein [Exophiala xenobiotica]|uniref:H/ACA ribonucleoprotein complex subunit 2 n=1 Tax=Vermiconidia calcicola TaxID=1690605 RepID=A0AAV9PYP9_9PEZI|nr:snoRNA-binding protein [Exophiala xenobiotica]KAK5531303.1 snoRNA-binding protein [Vermiconidia calcicola]KAK5540632.1 snoRNA-binding protein [Chaetothyriales sp. CCFEE 6169]KAK5191564.1 snoRNA-binding protein [Exophiala xenobiotica]KAK5218388.1 snoRNA-binding protein [Exophiala xenobiotica]